MSKNKEKHRSEDKQAEKDIQEAQAEMTGETAEPEVIEPEKPKEKPENDEAAKLKEQLLRNMAEYDNYRKRTAKEKSEMIPEITAKVVSEFLPVLDSLERALSAECTDEKYKEGVKMISDTFLAALEKLGVEKVPAEDFDPSVHQAVQQVQSDELESGKIAAVFQNGYKIGSKVLRFAMVSVVQ